MESVSEDAYDLVRYPGQAYPRAHPDHMAVAAILCGMEPAPVEQCRVLEIGCNQGGNLIPMAYWLPRSEFVGIDRAATTIARAQARIQRTGLTNIRVQAMDLVDVGPEFGEFDYIIAHGIYAWVPQPVREKLLTLCKERLKPNGVAYVSYNTYPAGHLRAVSRDAMGFHAAAAGLTGEKRVPEGKAFLKFLMDSTLAEIGKAVYRSEFERQRNREDEGIFHDELAADYTPCYFAEFMTAAEEHKLQFLAETRLADMLKPPITPEALELITQFSGEDLIAFHQYLDFLTFRGFRETLLCHPEIRLRRSGAIRAVERMYVASPLRKFGVMENGETEFRMSRKRGRIATANPMTIAVAERLEEMWPREEHFDHLFAATASTMPPECRPQAREDLAKILIGIAAMGLAEFRTRRIPAAARLSEKPMASPLARIEAEAGDVITTLLHQSMQLEDASSKRFILLLDGTRTHSDLVECMAREYPAIPADKLEAQTRANLLDLFHTGLLVA